MSEGDIHPRESGLSVRVANALYNGGLKSSEAVIAYRGPLMSVRHIGYAAMKEIRGWIARIRPDVHIVGRWREYEALRPKEPEPIILTSPKPTQIRWIARKVIAWRGYDQAADQIETFYEWVEGYAYDHNGD